MPVHQVYDTQLEENESISEENTIDLPRISKRTPVKREICVSYSGWIGENSECFLVL